MAPPTDLKLTHPAALVGAALLLVIVAWSAGFAWFVHQATRDPAAPPVGPQPTADGIVALTGGADRVETALHLLVDGRGRLLLLSGIGGGAELPELAHRAAVDPGPLNARVTLGRSATDTRGNAAEAAAWVRANQLRSLLVVTASYHMPRALTELVRVMPDVTLHPVPVIPAGLHGGTGLRDAGLLRLMAEEYTKWLIAWAGLSAFGPQHAPPPPRAAGPANPAPGPPFVQPPPDRAT